MWDRHREIWRVRYNRAADSKHQTQQVFLAIYVCEYLGLSTVLIDPTDQKTGQGIHQLAN